MAGQTIAEIVYTNQPVVIAGKRMSLNVPVQVFCNPRSFKDYLSVYEFITNIAENRTAIASVEDVRRYADRNVIDRTVAFAAHRDYKKNLPQERAYSGPTEFQGVVDGGDKGTKYLDTLHDTMQRNSGFIPKWAWPDYAQNYDGSD